jgi:peptidoglycan/xylan/chitin deacetylase (PgdA/CDA1 family)
MPRHPPLALAYHGAGAVPLARDPWRLFCSPAAIRRDIEALRAWGYELVTFGELAARIARGEGAGAAALTFDDGLDDGLLAVLDGAPATAFVVTGWLGEPHPDAPFARVADAGGIRALHAAGVEIGAHTLTHPDLTSLAPAAAQEELAGSKRVLEELIQAPVTSAAYPYGAADHATRDAARRAGLLAACRTAGDGDLRDPFDLPRQAMGPGGTRLGLRLKREGHHAALMRVPLARRARRLSRRLRTARR